MQKQLYLSSAATSNNKLTTKTQQIGDLWEYGFGLQEVADMLGIKNGHVSVALARLRKYGVNLRYARSAYAAVADISSWTDKREALASNRELISPVTRIRRTEYGNMLALDPCSYCGIKRRTSYHRTVDHIESLATGGTDDETNITAACRRCNTRKMNTPMLHFLLSLKVEREIDVLLAEKHMIVATN